MHYTIAHGFNHGIRKIIVTEPFQRFTQTKFAKTEIKP